MGSSSESEPSEPPELLWEPSELLCSPAGPRARRLAGVAMAGLAVGRRRVAGCGPMWRQQRPGSAEGPGSVQGEARPAPPRPRKTRISSPCCGVTSSRREFLAGNGCQGLNGAARAGLGPRPAGRCVVGHGGAGHRSMGLGAFPPQRSRIVCFKGNRASPASPTLAGIAVSKS